MLDDRPRGPASRVKVWRIVFGERLPHRGSTQDYTGRRTSIMIAVFTLDDLCSEPFLRQAIPPKLLIL